MEYREFHPHPALAEAIECYWSVKSSENGNGFRTIYPDGCMDIILNTGDNMLTRHGERTEESSARCFIVGNMSGPIQSGCRGKIDLTGIRFKAGGLSQFLRIPLREFNDRSIAVDQIGHDFDSINIAQFASLNYSTRIDFLDAMLLARRLPSPTTPWQMCLSIIVAAKGNCRIERLAREVGISVKHLERQFHHYVGISPKELCRVLGFREARERLLAADYDNLLQLSWDLGYTDHAHLTRTFKRFAGINPSEFVLTG